jgi:hypothetical protein
LMSSDKRWDQCICLLVWFKFLTILFLLIVSLRHWMGKKLDAKLSVFMLVCPSTKSPHRNCYPGRKSWGRLE